MKNLKTFESFEMLPGGRASELTLASIADRHGVKPEELQKQFEVGHKVEMEHTPDPEVAKEIALDHLAEDPEYYTKLVKSGVVDEPEALKIYKDLFEGDWWDNDPSAPWNQDYREPDEYMEVEYKKDQQLFEFVCQPAWMGIVKGKGSIEGYWVINLDDVPEEYKLVYDWGEDAEKEYHITEDTVVNYATDLYKDPKELKTPEEWEDGGALLAPLSNASIVDYVADDIETALAPGYRSEPYGRFAYSQEEKGEMRKALHLLSKLKFD